MQIRTECLNENCGRALLIEDYRPNMVVPCPFCGEEFAPPAPNPGTEKIVLPNVKSAVQKALPKERPLEIEKDEATARHQAVMNVNAKSSSPKLAKPEPARQEQKPLMAIPVPDSKPPAATRPKAPSTMVVKMVKPAPKKPAAPTAGDDFEVIEESNKPMMAIPIDDDPPPPKPPPKPAVMKAILIDDEPPVPKAILIKKKPVE